MYLGINNGLGVYNGYDTKVYSKDTTNPENGPLSNILMEFYETKDGMLWFGYMDIAAISYFNPATKKFTHFEHNPKDSTSFPNTAISRFHEDSKGILWAGTWGEGFIQFNKERTGFKRYVQDLNRIDWLVTNNIRVVQEFEPDKYLIGNFDEGRESKFIEKSKVYDFFQLRIFDSKKNIFYSFPINEYKGNLSDLAFLEIKHILTICHFIYQDKENNKLWVGTYSGLVMIDLKNKFCTRITPKSFDENQSINLDNTINYITDEHGRLWVSTTNSGIMVVDTKTNKSYYSSHLENCSDCVGDNKVLSFTKDGDGNIWVSNASRGVSIYHPFKNKFRLVSWNKLNAKFSNSSSQLIPCNFILPRGKKYLYISSASGISIYNYQSDSLIETISNFNDYSGKSSYSGLSTFKLYNNKIYFAGYGLKNSNMNTLVVYDLKSRKQTCAGNQHIYSVCFPLDTLNENIYALSNKYSDLFKFNNSCKPDTFHIFPDKKSPEPLYSHYLNNGNWFFSRNIHSFIVFNPKTKETIVYSGKNDGDKYFPDSTINSFCYNKKGTMWIATQNALYSYDEKNGEITNWNNLLNIERRGFNYVSEDASGYVWLAFGRDIYRFHPKEKKLFSFSRAIGLPYYGFENYRHHLYSCIDSNTLFFPTHKGLLYFNTSNINLPTTVPKLSIYRLNINDSLAPESILNELVSGKLKLSYQENNLQLLFSTGQLITPYPTRFYYMLNGLHNAWQLNETGNKISLYNLAWGNHELRVKCENTYGVESKEVIIRFTISKPFWLSWWFILLSLGSLITLIYAFVKQRERKLMARQQELEKIISERTQEIREKAKEIESQKEVIEQKQEEILDSIYYARRIQNALLAGDNLLNENLPAYFIYYQPKDIVSGDFYWATQLGNRFYFIVADSTGHGVPGAFMSLLNINYLNEAINEKQIENTGEILDYVRNRLIRSLSENNQQEGGNDGMDCTLVCIDTQKKTLQYSGAQNPIMLYRNDELQILETDRMPVGKSPKQETPFNTYTIQLNRGDIVYLSTDGYSDQFGGEKGKKLKFKNFKNYVKEIALKKPEEQHELLKQSFNSWKGSLEQIDDVCVAGIFF